MKKSILKTLLCTSIALTITTNAFSGAIVDIYASQLGVNSAAVVTGIAAAPTLVGLSLYWGFIPKAQNNLMYLAPGLVLLILEDEGLITQKEHQYLAKLDISEQEALIEQIISSNSKEEAMQEISQFLE